VTCDLCGLELEAGETPAGHVWIRHVPGYVCWCGVDIVLRANFSGWRPEDKFKEHCDSRGGYFAHYLESKLGDRDG
jgi:hypothetical protein